MAKDLENSGKAPGSHVERIRDYIWYVIIMGTWLGFLSLLQEGFHSLKRYDYSALPKHTGEIVVLTGGTRGIGLDVLKKLLQLDYYVIFGVRNIDAGLKAIKAIRLQGIKSGRAKCLNLDLKSLKSVRKFSKTVLKEAERIDLLINNAGVMFEPYGLTEDGYEVHFQVNHLSHFLLTQLLLPKIKETASKKSTNCRVVNVSSLAHKGASASDMKDVSNPQVYSAYRAYFDSKLCQILTTKYQDAQLKSEAANVNIYALHPGVIVTDLYVNLPIPLEIIRWLKTWFRSTDDGAEVVIYAAISPELEGDGGHYIANKQKYKPASIAEDISLQKFIWDLSNNCINSGKRLLAE